MAEGNAEVPDDKRVEFRIGIDVGDVMAAGEDLLGDVVNVAAHPRHYSACRPTPPDKSPKYWKKSLSGDSTSVVSVASMALR